MSSCTLYVRSEHPDDAIAIVVSRAKDGGVEVHPMTKETGGQDWTRLILGTHNFIRQKAASTAREKVLEHLVSTTFAVGVGIGPHDGPVARIKLDSLLSGLDSMIFDGRTMLNERFQDLLSKEPNQPPQTTPGLRPFVSEL